MNPNTWDVLNQNGQVISTISSATPVSTIAQGGTPLWTPGGYSTVAGSTTAANPQPNNAPATQTTGSGGLPDINVPTGAGSTASLAAGTQPTTPGASSSASSAVSGNVFSSAWSTGDADERVLIILMVLGVLLQLAGK